MANLNAFFILAITLSRFSHAKAEFTLHECEIQIHCFDQRFDPIYAGNDMQENHGMKVSVKSSVFNRTFEDFKEMETMIPDIIPVLYFDENKKKRGRLNTKGFKYFESTSDICTLTLRLQNIDSSKIPRSISARISCNDQSSFEVTKIKLTKLIGENVHFSSQLKAFETRKNELKEFRELHPKLSKLDDFLSYPFLNAVNPKRFKRDTVVSHTRYVEIAVVIDNGVYQLYNGETSLAASAVMDIMTYVDTIYRKYNIRIVLSTIEIWNVKDLTYITKSAEDTLDTFSIYAAMAFKEFDNVHLITTMEFNNNLGGLGYVGAMCSKTHSTGVSTLKKNVELSVVAGTVAHELGHNLNMVHDDSLGSCYCEEEQGLCLMHSRQLYPTPKHFSTCSQESLKAFLEKFKAVCLVNIPAIFSVSSNNCGNNKIDSGEECDCGSPTFCTNPCCDPLTCKLTPGSDCAHGECCHDCKILPENTVCRETGGNECDTIDYCNGINGTCVNLYAADGVKCDRDGICYQGLCKSRNLQCKYMFGNDARDADTECYDNANVYGEMYGHCGVIDSVAGTYHKCEPKNVFCGSLHCENVSVTYPIIGFKSQHSRVRLKIDGEYKVCYGGSADLGKENLNPGFVYDYTPCGVNKYCLNNTCTEMSITPSCVHNCQPNGVCSNLGRCQCSVGWSGDDCTIATEVLPRIPPKVVRYYEISSAVMIGHLNHVIWYMLIGILSVSKMNIL